MLTYVTLLLRAKLKMSLYLVKHHTLKINGGVKNSSILSQLQQWVVLNGPLYNQVT